MIKQMFEAEDQARLDFERQKKRGLADEEALRQEIKRMKEKLKLLIVKNQQVNFDNFARIQETIEEQDGKILEK